MGDSVFRIVLLFSSYTAIVAIIIYLSAYSKRYDWWKNPVGRVMNGSLIATIFVALGVTIRIGTSDDVGRIISTVGWIMFTVFIILRLRLFFSEADKRDKELDELAHRIDLNSQHKNDE